MLLERGGTNMARFLIEVTHSPDQLECAQVVDVFLKTGSHWVTNADWGCKDNDHRSWVIVDVETKDEARLVLPPGFRSKAKITKLNRFTVDEINSVLVAHP